MQKLEEKKAVMTEITDCNDLVFSDWENFTDDIDFASLEQSLEMTEANTETLNDKIINFLSDGEYYSQKRGGIEELDSSTYSKEETSFNDSFETQLRKFTSSLDSNPLPINPSNLSTSGKSPYTIYLKRDPRTETYYNFPRKIDPCVSNATIRNSFLPLEKNPALDDEKSFTFSDNLQLECIARDQRLIAQNYVNRNDKAVFIEKNVKCRMQDEENQKYTRTLPYISRLEVLNIQENSVSCPDQIVSSIMITGNQNNIPNKESAPCKNITSSKEHYDSERIIFLSDENFDSQKMIISSQESSDGQRMIISSQETSDSQRMITSSQESSGPENMIISSQEYLDSQKMITSSQDISESQKMIVSSQDSLDDQRIIFNQESFCGQESFDSKNLLSYQVPKEIPSYQETSVRNKLFNTRSRSFLKISKKINMKTENKSYRSLGSRLSLKDQKLHKFLDYKRFAGVMTTQYNGKKVSPPASIGKKYANIKEDKIIHIGEPKVRKIEIGMNEQKKFMSSRR